MLLQAEAPLISFHFLLTCKKQNENRRMQIRHSLVSCLILLLLSFFNLSLSAQESFTVKTVPNPKIIENGWVSDPAGKLSAEDRSRINSLINGIERSTTAEIAVVILPSIGDQVPKDFAVDLFNTWGIGKKGKDNGLLLLIVLDQRRWEFETGYGLEGDLPDVTLKQIGESKLVPGLRSQRMGDGIFNALQAIAEKLGAPQLTGEETPTQHMTPGGVRGRLNQQGSTDSVESSEEYSPNLVGFSPGEQKVLGILSGLYIAIVIVVSIAVYFSSQKKDTKTSGWEHLRYTIYWLIPGMLFLSVIYFTKPEWLFYLYYPIGALWAGTWRALKNRAVLQKGGDPYEVYKRLRADHDGLFTFGVILFPIPMAFLALYLLYKLRALRHTPRSCGQPSCGLTLVDEKGDDLFLEEGQRKEEQLGSVDYDVWHCSKCGAVRIFAYDAYFTQYSRCPSCSYKTYHSVNDRTVESPTCTSAGKGERDFRCEHCSYTRTESYTIPQRDCSKSSSSSTGSSYSSSGGGSFGGGRSGGGGAGGSW